MEELENSTREASALQEIIGCLSSFDGETQLRLLKTVITFFNINGISVSPSANERGINHVSPANLHYNEPSASAGGGSAPSHFSDRPPISAKEFLMDKNPITDVERVSVLAYYLTHYLNTRHFKTLDLTRLNTDAAQRKFTNAAVAVEGAARAGFFVPAVKGAKQLSGLGEQYVQALPDREAAAAVRSKFRSRRPKKGLKPRSE